MQDIARRIKELIDHLGLSNKSFAESIDIAPAIISHVLSGRNNPSLHLVQQITNVYTNVNLSYLLNGDGQLLNETRDKGISSASAPPQKASEALDSTPSLQSLPPGARYVSPPSGAPIPHSSASDLALIDEDNSSESSQDQPFVQEKASKKKKRSPKKKLASSMYELEGKEIERIVVFYSDRSFREYQPEG